MEKIFSANSLILIWLLFTLISPLCYAYFLWWGIKTGQFSSPEKSASLPLNSFIPEEDAHLSEISRQEKDCD